MSPHIFNWTDEFSSTLNTEIVKVVFKRKSQPLHIRWIWEWEVQCKSKETGRTKEVCETKSKILKVWQEKDHKIYGSQESFLKSVVMCCKQTKGRKFYIREVIIQFFCFLQLMNWLGTPSILDYTTWVIMGIAWELNRLKYVIQSVEDWATLNCIISQKHSMLLRCLGTSHYIFLNLKCLLVLKAREHCKLW